MSGITISINVIGRLYKTFVKDMPTLYYFITPMGTLNWEDGSWGRKKGWSKTYWKTFRELREYFEYEQKGKILPSSELEFLLDSGKSLCESFKKVSIGV